MNRLPIAVRVLLAACVTGAVVEVKAAGVWGHAAATQSGDTLSRVAADNEDRIGQPRPPGGVVAAAMPTMGVAMLNETVATPATVAAAAGTTAVATAQVVAASSGTTPATPQGAAAGPATTPATPPGAAAPGTTAATRPAIAETPIVFVARVDGVIHPIAAEFIGDAIDAADASRAAALIVTLETPGGLLESTRTIVSRIVAARTPIVVFVGPGAARAASAGFLITLAADVAVMATAAHIGAAHPVAGGGEGLGETMEKKAAADVAAYARSLAHARRRNVTLADQAVLQSRAFTADEARQAQPPLIDFIATDVDDVVRQLDARTVARFDGQTVTLHTAGARLHPLEMTMRQRFLGTIAHPQIAYLLFTLGLLGLTVEMWNPGSILPGVAGGLCLLLAFLAFQVLPINTTGLLLIAFGLGLLVLELKVPSFGVLGIGGAASLILGSVIMMNRTADVRVGLQFVVPAMIGLAAIFLFLGRLALQAQRQPTVAGAPAMIGETGRTLTAIPAGGVGHVSAHGEIWNARADRPDRVLAPGNPVRIVALDGLTVTVAPMPVPDTDTMNMRTARDTGAASDATANAPANAAGAGAPADAQLPAGAARRRDRASDPHASDPHVPDPHTPDPDAPDPDAPDPHTPVPRAPDPRASDPPASDPRASDPQAPGGGRS